MSAGARWVAVAGTLATSWFAGCSSDHGALAQRPRPIPSLGGTAGAAGHAGAAGESSIQGGGGGEGAVEPLGPDRLTLVHGVVDAHRLLLCFAHVRRDGAAPVLGEPVPPGGLSYAEAASVTSLPGLDLASDELAVTAIAVAPGAPSATDCAGWLALADQLRRGQGGAAGSGATFASGGQGGGGGAPSRAPSAGAAGSGTDGGRGGLAGATGAAGAEAAPQVPPPLVRSFPLVTIPAGTLTRGRSALLVVRGCYGGGTTHAGAEQEALCGTGYTPDHPTVAATFSLLSRLFHPDAVGVQALHAASRQEGDRSVELVAVPATGADIPLVVDAAPEVLAPRIPGYFSTDTFDATGRVEVRYASSTVVHQAPWSEVLRGVSLGPGTNLAFVLVGPGLSLDHGSGWWNPTRIVAVRAE